MSGFSRTRLLLELLLNYSPKIPERLRTGDDAAVDIGGTKLRVVIDSDELLAAPGARTIDTAYRPALRNKSFSVWLSSSIVVGLEIHVLMPREYAKACVPSSDLPDVTATGRSGRMSCSSLTTSKPERNASSYLK